VSDEGDDQRSHYSHQTIRRQVRRGLERDTYRQANQCNKAMWTEYWYGMLSKGVIPMGSGWFEEYSISVAHTQEDIDETLNITEDVLKSVKENV
jgi:glutamate-1-semialdehyde aminotransferase